MEEDQNMERVKGKFESRHLGTEGRTYGSTSTPPCLLFDCDPLGTRITIWKARKMGSEHDKMKDERNLLFCKLMAARDPSRPVECEIGEEWVFQKEDQE